MYNNKKIYKWKALKSRKCRDYDRRLNWDLSWSNHHGSRILVTLTTVLKGVLVPQETADMPWWLRHGLTPGEWESCKLRLEPLETVRNLKRIDISERKLESSCLKEKLWWWDQTPGKGDWASAEQCNIKIEKSKTWSLNAHSPHLMAHVIAHFYRYIILVN